MRNLLVIIIALTLTSCATRKERAVRHVNKALSLYPQVLTEFNTPIRLDTTIFITDTIVTPEKKVFLPVNEDSIKRALEKKLGVKTMLVENDKLKLELQKTKDGWFEFLATVKSDTIVVKDTVRIEIIKEVPVKGLERTVVKKGYWYYSGIFFNIFATLYILSYIWQRHKK